MEDVSFYVSRGGEANFEHFNLTIHPLVKKLRLWGNNGAGKTTLIKNDMWALPSNFRETAHKWV